MKEDQKATLEKMEKLAAELEANPATKAFRESEQAATLQRRTAAAAKIADLQIDMEATGILRREIDDMAAKLADMDAEREKMKTAINEKAYCLAREKSGIEGAIRREEEILLSCYDLRIDEQISYFRERFEALRKQTVNSQKQAESHVETKTITTFSNAGSIRRALSYCMEAVRQLEAMRLEPVFDPTKIERLRAEEPDADLLEEFSATKKRYNDEPTPGLLSSLRQATENHLDFVIGQLHEKAQKLLAPKRAGARG